MKILLIGGTGNVGSRLALKLLDMGADLAMVSRDPSRIPAGAKKIIADLRNPDWYAACKVIMPVVDVIIYVAYSTSLCAAEDRRVNYEALTEVISNIKTTRVIFFSSVGVYQRFNLASTICSEGSKKEFENHYQKDKIDACSYLQGISGISVRVLHLSIVWNKPCARFDEYKKTLTHSFITTKNISIGMYNLVHADDAADAAVLCLREPLIPDYDEYIVSGEAIRYVDFLCLLESYFAVSDYYRLPKFLNQIPLLKRILSFIGLRVRVPYTHAVLKAEMLNSPIVYSSEKLKLKLKWRPQKYLKSELFDLK
jgi:nucleoside-diphosphate-sugar epimerase